MDSVLSTGENLHVHIRSVWMLQLYASQAYVSGNIIDHASEHSAEDLPILVASMLCDSVEMRLRHELSVGFTQSRGDLTRVRGRIDLLRTQRHRLLEKGRIACQFNELTIDSPVNQYLLRALENGEVLLRHLPDKQAAGVASRCRRLMRHLEQLGVTRRAGGAPRPRGRLMSKDQAPVNIATLLLELAIPSAGAGTSAFARQEMDQHQLRALFEAALLGLYRHHLVPYGWSVLGGKQLYWDCDRHPLLPGMKTDIILVSPAGEVTIMDAKFTHMLAQRRFGELSTLKNGHLYQLYAYLRSQEHRGGSWVNARGILAYASTAKHEPNKTPASVQLHFDGHDIETHVVSVEQSLRDFRASALRLVNAHHEVST